MDMAQLENEVATALEAEQRPQRGNGAAQLPLDRLEVEVVQVLELRAKLKERCRTCAALIIEIERAL